jgi:hypothetical protein
VQILDGLFRKLPLDHDSGGPEIHYEYESKMYVQKNEDVKKLKWNGLEIRNGTVKILKKNVKLTGIAVFQTAVALGISDSKKAREAGVPEEKSIPKILEKHLAQVVGMSSALQKYIRDTHEGMEDDDHAMLLGNRAARHQIRRDASPWA